MVSKINNAGLSGTQQPMAIMGRTYEEAAREAMRLGIGSFKRWEVYVEEITAKHDTLLNGVIKKASTYDLSNTRDLAIQKFLNDYLKYPRSKRGVPNMVFIHDDLDCENRRIPELAFYLFSTFLVQDLTTDVFYRFRERQGAIDILPPTLVDRFKCRHTLAQR